MRLARGHRLGISGIGAASFASLCLRSSEGRGGREVRETEEDRVAYLLPSTGFRLLPELDCRVALINSVSTTRVHTPSSRSVVEDVSELL